MKHLFLLWVSACVWAAEHNPSPVDSSPRAIDQNPVASRVSNFSISEVAGFVHISKCGGASWLKELSGIFNTVSPRRHGVEGCYFWQRRKYPVDNFMVSLRSPRAHVWSQFTECVYSPWGMRQTIHTAFPRGGGEEQDFKTWLGSFLDMDRGFNTSSDRYKCYHPANYQARALTCDVKEPHDVVGSPPVYEPSFEHAKRSYHEFSWVGLNDFFLESKCLLYYRIRGLAKAEDFIDRYCRCDDRAQGASKRKEKGVAHVVHHANGHRDTTTMLDAVVLALIDRLTRTDLRLFRMALDVFLKEVIVMENALGRRVLCDATLRAAEQELAYFTPNVTARYAAHRAPGAHQY